MEQEFITFDQSEKKENLSFDSSPFDRICEIASLSLGLAHSWILYQDGSKLIPVGKSGDLQFPSSVQDKDFRCGSAFSKFSYCRELPIIGESGATFAMLVIAHDQPKELTKKEEILLDHILGDIKQHIFSNIEKVRHKKQSKDFQRNAILLNDAQRIAKIGAWEMDVATGKTYWTDEVYTIHELEKGFDHNKINGIEFYHPDYRELISNSITDAIRNKIKFEVDCKFITAKGNERWVRSSGHPIENQGKITHLVGIFQDITQLKEIEFEWFKQRERLDNIIRGTNVGTWEWNVQTGETIFNQRWAEIIGYDLQEISPVSIRTWMKYAHPEDLKQSEEALNRHFAGELQHYECESRMLHKDGHWVWVLDRGKVATWTLDGKPEWMYGTHQDITKDKLKEQYLIQAQIDADLANKAKSDFLANMSHEIRTPLNSVLGFSELLSRTDLDSIQKEYIQSISEAGKNLLGLINDILDLSKIESGRMDLFFEPTNIRKLLEQILRMFRSIASNKGLELNMVLSDDVPEFVKLDILRVKQVLINLVNNAIKFTRSGYVTLGCELSESTSANPNSVRINFYVKDTGVGIADEYQKKIFDIFSQEDESITRKYGGTGLGLTIANKLLSMMDSKLELQSKKKVGSTFHFTLDLEKTDPVEEANLPKHTKPSPISTEKQYKILVADDNQLNRILADHMIKALFPYSKIIEVENGKEAIEICQEQDFDLILMDIQMPEVSGYEASRKIREREISQGRSPVPIIAVSAGTMKNEKEVCLENGMNDYLPKPIQLQSIQEIMLRYLTA